MESEPALQISIRATNLMKIPVIFGVCVIHTCLWWNEFSSDRFYSMVIFCCIVFMLILCSEIINPKSAQFMKAMFFGSVPAIVIFYIPKYFIFAICAHFISINWGFDELNWLQMPYLFGGNTMSWMISLAYYQTKGMNDDSELKFLNLLMNDRSFIYQILMGFGMNYLVLGVIAINKYLKSQLKQKYESTLQHLNKELKVANDKLQRSNQELQDALQEKENFILRFSHEIRNPLNSLLGNVELCYEHTLDDEFKTMLQDAKVSGEILLQLLNNVLDAAKVSAGRLEVSVKTQSIRVFLEKVWVICSEIIRKKRLYGCLSVNVKVPDLLEFDHHRMIQIVINMISNSAKFTDAGHVKLFVDFIEGSEIKSEDMRPKYFVMPANRLDSGDIFEEEEINENPQELFESLTLQSKKFQLDQDNFLKHAQKEIQIPSSKKRGTFKNQETVLNDSVEIASTRFPRLSSNSREGYIRLEIVDSGCGISERDLENVFGKFKQLGNTNSKRQIGTGLGLWITKELVELMNGKIEIYSKAGRGSALVIMFKSKSSYSLLRLTSPQFYESEHQAPPTSLTNPEIQKVKRVLVVEDIPYNQEINRRLLEKCGIKNITIASNGKEAVDIYLSKKVGYFDLVLMDIDMPIMDGRAAVKIIRQEESKRNWIPARIVFLTAYSEAKTQQELLDKQGEYKANGFYSKPASLLTIKQILKESSDLERPLSSSHNQHILVVDDDSFNLEMMKKILKLCKYHTLEARNGQEAITIYEKHWRDIKVILMDCEMPVLDGLEATSRILSKHKQKAIFSNRKLRIIGLTGHVGAEYKQRCLKAGMEDVLEKPIKIERLNALLNQN